MSKLEVLRKLIREEVRAAIKEELTPILKEIKSHTSAPITKSFTNSLKEEVTRSKKIQSVSTGDPIMDLLNETKQTMTGDEYKSMINADASMAQGFPAMMSNPTGATQVVESVDQMLANTRPASDVTQVQIDSVPDFSALMGKMKSNGQI